MFCLALRRLGKTGQLGSISSHSDNGWLILLSSDRERKIRPKFFCTILLCNPLGLWTSARLGHGCPHPNAYFSKVLRACPKFSARDVSRISAPQTFSLRCFSFLICHVEFCKNPKGNSNRGLHRTCLVNIASHGGRARRPKLQRCVEKSGKGGGLISKSGMHQTLRYSADSGPNSSTLCDSWFLFSSPHELSSNLGVRRRDGRCKGCSRNTIPSVIVHATQ